MEKSLKWFKYEPKVWDSGKISIETYEVQGCFMACCRLYWERLADLDIEFMRAKIRDDQSIDRLIEKGFIEVKNQAVSIKWMNEEISTALGRQQKAKNAIAKRWNTNKVLSSTASNTNTKENKINLLNG